MDRLTTAPADRLCLGRGGRHDLPSARGELANFVGVVERKDWRELDGAGTRAEALADFAGWHPAVTGLIEQADTHYQWGLFDRAHWTSGMTGGSRCWVMPVTRCRPSWRRARCRPWRMPMCSPTA